MPTFDFLFKKLKILPFYGDKLWGKWNFSWVYLFLHYGFILIEEIVNGNGEYQEK